MAWFDQFISGLGQQNAPFGFDAQPVVGAPSQDNPAYRSGMQMLGNIGAGMLASGSRNPAQAFGRAYLGAQEQAQQQNKNQYIAAEMMSAAEEKKQKRQEEAELRQKRNDWLKFVSDPNRRSMLEAYPELTDEYIQATDPVFQKAESSSGSSNFGMSVVPMRNKRTGELAPGQFNQGSGGVFINGEPVDPNDWAFDPGALSQDKAAGTAIGKTQGGATADLPGAKRQAEITTAKVDELASNKNLDAALGWTSYLPDAMASNEVIDVRAKVDELMGGAFLEARTVLKGGGQITDFESARAERAYARMERAMQSSDPKVFRDALDDFKAAINDGVSKLRATATGGAPAAPAAPAGGGTQQRLKFNPATGELE